MGANPPQPGGHTGGGAGAGAGGGAGAGVGSECNSIRFYVKSSGRLLNFSGKK